MTDDPHPRQRQAENFGDPGLDRIDPLGRFPDGQPVALPTGHAAVQLHRGMQLALGAVALLEDHIGLGEAPGQIPPLVALALA